MYKKVLVAYDDSETSHQALKEALALTQGVPDAEVVVLKIVEWHDYNAETFKIASTMSGVRDDSIDMNAITEIGTEAESLEIDRITNAIAEVVGDRSDVNIAIVNGSPHDSIVEYASDNDCDCIVMGHRGMGRIRGLLGSVAFSVLQKANKPVLVVK